MGLHRIIYCSRGVGDPAETVPAILAACRANNPPAHVTGALLFDEGCFLQMLEGPRAEVSRIYARICTDPRHDRIELVQAGPTEMRLFADWAMHDPADVTADAAPSLARYHLAGRFDPRTMDWRAIEAMLLEIATRASARRLAAL